MKTPPTVQHFYSPNTTDYEPYVKTAFTALGAIGGYLYGGWSDLIGVLIALIIIDYGSGFALGFIKGNLSSSAGLKGIARKVGIVALVAVAHLLDTCLTHTNMLRDATLMFFIVNEVVSILENSGKLGLPIPPMLKRAIKTLQDEELKG